MPNPTGYSASQIWLHWIVALLIVLQFALKNPISEAWRAMGRGEEVAFSPLIGAHVAGGLLVLALVIWRLVLRVTRGAPQPPAEESAPLRLVAKATHGLLYLLLIGMPVSGATAWIGGIEAAAGVHSVLRVLMLLFVALHVAGALYHQFVLKNNLLARMKRPG
jgi:cytochrome b561